MATGKVLRFDEFRGYGFIAPDNGGEDVFIHVNDLDFDKRLLGPGMKVEFDVEDGGRGLKASKVRFLGSAPEREYRTPPPVRVPSGSPADEGMCDVLSVKEFIEEITETILGTAPTVTSAQILQVRQGFVQVALSHGWIDAEPGTEIRAGGPVSPSGVFRAP
ncbi:cold shock domain-containing protein [Streptomyces sp. NBC_00237]|uniref:cold-shock protein n=1 Tax=Streptomyces sp. NBC_00237 TaxID=2975687 RepID=UPI00224DB59C|nr:cold shock domain-containing protein [Streptomyces sp. NBC_00237]MCX5206639.1 cold shock domain-containing protein [Streptomyces sp. NBC_00237]